MFVKSCLLMLRFQKVIRHFGRQGSFFFRAAIVVNSSSKISEGLSLPAERNQVLHSPRGVPDRFQARNRICAFANAPTYCPCVKVIASATIRSFVRSQYKHIYHVLDYNKKLSNQLLNWLSQYLYNCLGGDKSWSKIDHTKI